MSAQDVVFIPGRMNFGPIVKRARVKQGTRLAPAECFNLTTQDPRAGNLMRPRPTSCLSCEQI